MLLFFKYDFTVRAVSVPGIFVHLLQAVVVDALRRCIVGKVVVVGTGVMSCLNDAGFSENNAIIAVLYFEMRCIDFIACLPSPQHIFVLPKVRKAKPVKWYSVFVQVVTGLLFRYIKQVYFQYPHRHSGYRYSYIDCPPSTRKLAPVTKDASSLAR